MRNKAIQILASVVVFAVAASPVLAQQVGGSEAASGSADAAALTAEPGVDAVSPEAAAPPADIELPPTETAPGPIPPADQAAPPAPPLPCGEPANPWGFTFCGGNLIRTPPADLCTVFACIPTFWRQVNGYVVECRDMLLSHSGGVRGACSGHGGELRPLYAS
jgi:hypothetical protein